MRISSKNESGFTILELIIASTIFSVMLLLTTRGIIEIGRVYYKGVVTSRTQETTRSIVDDISRSLQLTGNSTVGYSAPGPEQATCVGTTRYTYKLNSVFSADNSHVLWVDKINFGAACTAPSLSTATPSDSNSDISANGQTFRKELLAKNMRLTNFNISQVGSPTLMNVNVRVAFGDIDLSPDGLSCLPINVGGQFCSISELNTVVKKRLD